MIEILIDTTIIVALITLFGVIISSVIAPLVIKYFGADDDKEE